MPSFHGFLKSNKQNFSRIRQGARLGCSISDCLFAVALLQGIPNVVGRLNPALYCKLNDLKMALLKSVTLQIGDAAFAVHDFEDFIILDPDFEPFMHNWFRPGKGEVFVDIGSHVGKYSIPTAKAVGEQGRVIAVEPHPETFKALLRNVELNCLRNLVAFNYAAWNRSSILQFYVGGTFSEFSVQKSTHGKSIDVQAKRMDELLIGNLRLKRVDWIKIDAEKAELEILEGLEETLKKFKPKLFIEVWNKNMDKVKALLKRYGYNIIVVSNTFGSTSDWCLYIVCI